MPGIGITQDLRFNTQPIPIAGRRILVAAQNAALPAAVAILEGAFPSGYTDLGAVAQGKVDVAVEVTKDAIELGRIPTPLRYYLTGQKGSIKASLQEYQPQIIDIAAGNDGSPATAAGYTYTYIGGKLGNEKRVLVFDDFDVNFANDGFLWDQYWWTSPVSQGGGTFTLAENKAETVIPYEVDLLYFTTGGLARLLEYRAINHS